MHEMRHLVEKEIGKKVDRARRRQAMHRRRTSLIERYVQHRKYYPAEAAKTPRVSIKFPSEEKEKQETQTNIASILNNGAHVYSF